MTPLTDEQKKEIQGEVVPMDEGIPVRFVDDRKTYNITTGEYTHDCNIIYATFYWIFTKETALKVAKYTGTKAVFDK